MMFSEMQAKLAGWRIEILATDLSSEIIAKARAGSYSQFEVQRGLPIAMLGKYFKQDGDRWQLADSIRNQVTFREYNLLEHPRSPGQRSEERRVGKAWVSTGRSGWLTSP